MKKDPEKLAAAQQAVNTARIFKGQYINIATCDPQGAPNVAPIGSMRVVDENTAHVLQGFLFQSYKNLERNPKAAFSVCLRPKLGDFFKLFKRSRENAMGYQIYGELIRVDDSQAAVEQEYRQLASRVPFFLRRLFLRFCRTNLKRLLTFQITGVRAIGAPG
jgi:predicted pyridoxine 5'-phosphate oxidase superfamily flavin-nucleotide-binding protein